MDNSASQMPAVSILEPGKYRQLPWLAVVLSFLVLSVIAALAFQNLQLKKQISSITPPLAGGSQITPAIAPSSIIGQKELIVANISSETNNDPYSIEDLSFNNSFFIVDVSYGGGCKQHDFELYWDGNIAYSKPAQATFYLIHNSNGDRCEAMISRKLVFDISKLEKIREKIVITLYNYSVKTAFPEKVTIN